MSVIYRLYTEDINRDEILELTEKSFPEFSILTGQGSWQGQTENSLVIEIIQGNEVDNILEAVDASIFLLAANIREMNDQQAVMVTKQPIQSFIV